MKATVDALVQVALYSAAITAGILLFRFIFKNRISPKLQYLMWWLLILRLRRNWLLRLLILLLRCNRLLRLLYRFNNWRKQRFVWTIIQQRFHWRKFKIIQRERIRPSRLFAGITLLLSLRKLTSQFSLCRSICIFCVYGHIMLILFAIALLLCLGELTCQFILLHRIDFIIVILIARIILIALGFTGFLFRRTL